MQILDVFYHDTEIHDISISFNKSTKKYLVTFILENDEFGCIKCTIPNAIFIDIKKNLTQIGATDVIMDIDENIDSCINEILLKYIEYHRSNSDTYQFIEYKIFTNSASVIELYTESRDVTIEPVLSYK